MTRIGVALYVFMVLSSTQAMAQGSVFLEELTWTEVRDAVQAGKTTVIVPTGGTEQNGPHMILGKHNIIVKFTAGEIAKQLGNALVAPVVAYVPEGPIDPPARHMLFPGTITLPRSTSQRSWSSRLAASRRMVSLTSCSSGTAAATSPARKRLPTPSTRSGPPRGSGCIMRNLITPRTDPTSGLYSRVRRSQASAFMQVFVTHLNCSRCTQRACVAISLPLGGKTMAAG